MSAQAAASRAPVEAVVVGASAGGVEAMLQLFGTLRAGWRLPLVAVVHLAERRDSLLADVFSRRVAIPVREACDKEAIAAGTLYFAPAGYHLLVEHDRTFALSCEAPLHHSRPAIDILMDSAADAYRERLAGILLTGANSDGAEGLAAIKRRGGLTIVQDPDEAAAGAMPRAALARRTPDRVLRLADIAQLLAQLDLDPCLPRTPSSC